MWPMMLHAAGSPVFGFATRNRGAGQVIAIFTWTKLTLVLLVLVGGFALLSGRRGSARMDLVLLALVLYAGKVIHSTGASLMPVGVSSVFPVLVPILLYGLTQVLAKSVKDVRGYMKGAVGLGVLPALFMPIEFAMRTNPIFPDARYAGAYRASGTLGNPNYMGLYLALILSLALYFWLRERRMRYVVVTGLLTMAIVLTLSRKVMILVPMVFLIMFLSRRYISSLIPIVLFMGMLSWVLLQVFQLDVTQRMGGRMEQTEDAYNDRVSVVKAGWRLFKDHPIMGAGYGNSGLMHQKYRKELRTSKRRALHNQFMTTAAEQGLVGFLLFGVAFFAPFLRILRWLRHERMDDRLIRALVVGLVVFMVASMGGDIMENLNISPMYWVMAAFIMRGDPLLVEPVKAGEE